MTESEIRKKAIKILEQDGYTVWYPYHVQWKKEVDVFGVYDLIAVWKHMIKFIQLTTLSNKSARIKKVQGFLDRSGAKISSYVWAWDKKKKVFNITKI